MRCRVEVRTSANSKKHWLIPSCNQTCLAGKYPICSWFSIFPLTSLFIYFFFHITHSFIFMVDFPARHVCGSIKFASVYICSTMCENRFYNFYHQLWWMGKSQKIKGQERNMFLYISSFRWWFLLKENPIVGRIDAHSWWSNPGVFCNFPHISCSTPRTLHDFRTWVWKKK